MKNNKGFTLVELIAIIAIIGLIVVLTTTSILNGQKNAKKTLLNSKIESIEKAAVLYGQANKSNFTDSSCNLCNDISNCYCYNTMTTVEELINKKILSTDQDSDDILNPLNNESLKGCKVQIYMKYDKIYAVYDKTTNYDTCYYDIEETTTNSTFSTTTTTTQVAINNDNPFEEGTLAYEIYKNKAII